MIDAIIRLAERAARPPRDLTHDEGGDLFANITQQRRGRPAPRLQHRRQGGAPYKIGEIKENVLGSLAPEGSDVDPQKVAGAFKDVEKEIVRGDIIETGTRIDGRGLADIRPIVCEVGVLPRTHGSALFTRGETQALVVADARHRRRRAICRRARRDVQGMLHASLQLPALLGGRDRPDRLAGRREIGHGKLAWRAIHPMLPGPDQFPYTIRVVSEITESNGSSSMATVCGASLSLMDAGVPMKRPVAGIAMGLIQEGERFAVLSDILGDEDHLGDMDFKVAGTHDGITSLQMDIKITGITEEIMRIALYQAKDGRAAHPRQDGRGPDRRRAPALASTRRASR